VLEFKICANIVFAAFGYIGQGMIMGMRSAVSMFIGSVLGFGILSPIARTSGWASGPVDDWKKGAKGWILWISLAMMTSECISSSFVLIYDSFNLKSFNFRKLFPKKNVAENEGLILNSDSDNSTDEKPELETLPNHFLIPRKWWIGGLVISSFLCILIISLMFNQMFYEPLLALIFALVVSLLAVRALGETDLNPVSGIGKISQIFFGVISPNNVVGNIIAGAISEAGAQQAGDLMQAFKTGYLLNASPRAQFYGTISGTFVSILFSIIAYKLYVSAYGVPSSTLPAPTAQVWVDMAEFMSGGSLAQNVLPFCIVFALVAAALPILPKFISESRRVWIPSGVAMAVGMYVTPNWTLARLVGAIGQYIWKRRNPVSHGAYMVIIASGFVLGEGVMSIFTALLKNWGVNS
jgi:OPT family oligopeptide transporter